MHTFIYIHSYFKGPEAGKHLVAGRSRKKSSVAEAVGQGSKCYEIQAGRIFAFFPRITGSNNQFLKGG